MTISQRKELAVLLAERVLDKSDRNDLVGMFTTARMLDQVNEEIRELDEAAPLTPPLPATATGARRIFVKG